MPDRNPKRLSNWKMTCTICHHTFPERKTMEEVQKHFLERHGTEKIDLDLKWVGVGPAPASKFN
jgi:hypothetical protein